MTFLRTSCLALLPANLFLAVSAHAGEIYVPNSAPTTAGNGGYSTLMHSDERSYQLVVGPQELGGMPAGSIVTGVTWRRPSWIVYSDWPGTGNVASFTNYDIYLSSSNNPPGSLSTTYTDNIGSDVVQVRGGSLVLSGADFPGGALSPNVNPFGVLIPFSIPYTYQGGDLLLTIRHTGNGFSSGYLDTLSSPYAQAIGVSSYTQTDNWYAQNLITMKLVFDDPVPGTAYCPGDGSGGQCPCANNSAGPGGCDWGNASFPEGGVLDATGSASIVANNTILMATGIENNFGIFFGANNQVNGGAGNPLQDGLRCAGGGLVRLISPTMASGNQMMLPAPVQTLDTGAAAGVTRRYQYWFRTPTGPCGLQANLTNGYEIVWLP